MFWRSTSSFCLIVLLWNMITGNCVYICCTWIQHKAALQPWQQVSFHNILETGMFKIKKIIHIHVQERNRAWKNWKKGILTGKKIQTRFLADCDFIVFLVPDPCTCRQWVEIPNPHTTFGTGDQKILKPLVLFFFFAGTFLLLLEACKVLRPWSADDGCNATVLQPVCVAVCLYLRYGRQLHSDRKLNELPRELNSALVVYWELQADSHSSLNTVKEWRGWVGKARHSWIFFFF